MQRSIVAADSVDFTCHLRPACACQSRDEVSPQPAKQAQALLDLTLYYTSVGAYVTAFEMAQQARQFLTEVSPEDKNAVDRTLLAQLQDTVATYLHLNNDLVAAAKLFRVALKVM